MMIDWLQKRTTVEEAEQANLVEAPELGCVPLPFGFQNDRWLRLKEQLRAGDELWEFASASDSWQHLAGRAGICIVRNGEVVDSIVTVMN